MEIIIGCLLLLVIALLVFEHKLAQLDSALVFEHKLAQLDSALSKHIQDMHQPRGDNGRWLPKKR